MADAGFVAVVISPGCNGVSVGPVVLVMVGWGDALAVNVMLAGRVKPSAAVLVGTRVSVIVGVRLGL